MKDGYFYVFETHKHQFKEECVDKMMRYYILTKKDAKGRQVLHRAAECGDKHFCTMICYEAKKLEFVDEIIDTRDGEGLTPLYLLAEVGYRKKYDEDDEEMALLHGLGKTVVEEVAIDRDNLDLDEEGAAAAVQAKQAAKKGELKNYDAKQVIAKVEKFGDLQGDDTQEKIDKMLAMGLYYTTREPLVELRDLECSDAPSRNYICKCLMDFGADPNVQSPEVLHTPLHWFAYWGDHHAAYILLQLNRQDYIQPSGCCQDQDKYIRKYGAFNLFQTSNGQTPADIAGDLNNRMTLKEIVDYFLNKQKDVIRNAFITPEIKLRFDKDRFTTERTKNITFTAEDTRP